MPKRERMLVNPLAVLDCLACMVFVVDESHRLLFANEPFLRMIGQDQSEVFGQDMRSLLIDRRCEQFSVYYEEVCRTRKRVDFVCYEIEPEAHNEVSLVPYGNVIVITVKSVTRLARAIDELTWSNDVAQELLQQFAQANRKIFQEQQTDALTGLVTRGRIEEYANGVFEVMKARQLPMSVLLVDIDRFKIVNDTHGHDFGDQVLKAVAKALHEDAPEGTLTGRYGGEEFLIVLPQVGSHQAVEYAENRRLAVESLTQFGDPVTASFGVASLSPIDLSWRDIFMRADQALYQSKAEGRNQVQTKAA